MATVEDAQLAYRLAGEALGRSLEELLPQTRQLLVLVDRYVGRRSQRRKNPANGSASRSANFARPWAGATINFAGTWRGWSSWSTSCGIRAARRTSGSTCFFTTARGTAASGSSWA